MKSTGLMMVVFLVTAMGFGGTAVQERAHDAAYEQAKEQLADFLASEDCRKVEVSAGTFDRALGWIYRAVDTYLDKAVPTLGGAEAAGKYGVEVLRGLNEHKVRFAGDDGHDLVGDRNFLIASEQDAVDLGEVLARVAAIIQEAHVGQGVNIQSAAKKVFESLLPTAGANQPLVSQYLVQLRIMTQEEGRDLIRHLRK